MTPPLRKEIGKDVYRTLTLGLENQHLDWLERVEGRGNSYTIFVTEEGVDNLREWSPEQLDDLSGIGPAKAQRIWDALHPDPGENL